MRTFETGPGMTFLSMTFKIQFKRPILPLPYMLDILLFETIQLLYTAWSFRNHTKTVIFPLSKVGK